MYRSYYIFYGAVFPAGAWNIPPCCILSGAVAMFEESEIINLILGLVSLVIVYYELGKRRIPDFQLFFAGFILVILARIFTVVEGLFWTETFNILEHISYAVSGLIFAAGCISLSKSVLGKKG